MTKIKITDSYESIPQRITKLSKTLKKGEGVRVREAAEEWGVTYQAVHHAAQELKCCMTIKEPGSNRGVSVIINPAHEKNRVAK